MRRIGRRDSEKTESRKVQREPSTDKIGKSVSALIKILRTRRETPEKRIKCIDALTKLVVRETEHANEIMDTIICSLYDENKDVRLRARLAIISIITDIRTRDICFMVINDALHEDTQPNDAKIGILTALGDAATDEINISPSFSLMGELLNHEDEKVRLTTIDLCAICFEMKMLTWGYQPALVSAVELLKNEDSEIRFQAVSAIAQFASVGADISETKNHLLRVCRDPSEKVRTTARLVVIG